MVAEVALAPRDLILPVFILEGSNQREPVACMPGVDRLSVDLLVGVAEQAASLGIPALALFPVTPTERKTEDGREAWNEDNLVCRALRAIKRAVPEIGLIADVALDPYTSHGQDGLIRDGVILNDETIEALCRQALCQAAAGCDIVAPSDMMDGRISAIRAAWTSGLQPTRDPVLRRQVRFGLLRAVPRCGRLGRRARQGRQEDLPDGPGQQRRGAARGRARPGRGRRHGDGQAGPALPRHPAPGEGRVRRADLRLPGLAASTR